MASSITVSSSSTAGSHPVPRREGAPGAAATGHGRHRGPRRLIRRRPAAMNGQLAKTAAPFLVVAEHVEARARRRKQHDIPVPGHARRHGRRRPRRPPATVSTITWPDRSPRWWARPRQMQRPCATRPAMVEQQRIRLALVAAAEHQDHGPVRARRATAVDAMFVALESLIQSTPPASATTSRRCSRPGNVRRPSSMA
jgi:hypothetical protein